MNGEEKPKRKAYAEVTESTEDAEKKRTKGNPREEAGVTVPHYVVPRSLRSATAKSAVAAVGMTD